MGAEAVARRGLVILDRDGVLNSVVVDPEHGTIDSPLHPSQVQVPSGVPDALARLTGAGFALAIATNQPAWAKGKTTRANLEAVHARVVELVQSSGASILSSHLCLHRAEDSCACRKPKPGLLLEALGRQPQCSPEQSWMIGDGITDMQAGIAAGVNTAFLGPRKCDACGIMTTEGIFPTVWGKSLDEVVAQILTRGERTE